MTLSFYFTLYYGFIDHDLRDINVIWKTLIIVNKFMVYALYRQITNMCAIDRVQL